MRRSAEQAAQLTDDKIPTYPLVSDLIVNHSPGHLPGFTGEDFSLPKEVRFLHQAHFNAFVPPASKDWQAYEWQPGDYIKHFAGCPWQERPCLDKMYEAVEYAKQQAAEVAARKGIELASGGEGQ